MFASAWHNCPSGTSYKILCDPGTFSAIQGAPSLSKWANVQHYIIVDQREITTKTN